MEKSKVYHCKELFITFNGEKDFPNDYEFVAEVESQDLDEIFQLTNNIESSWTQNSKVEAIKDKLRSTSVGDIVILPDQSIWKCDMMGWSEINKN